MYLVLNLNNTGHHEINSITTYLTLRSYYFLSFFELVTLHNLYLFITNLIWT